MVKIWIAAMIIFIIVEAATVGLASVWFALGAAAALIAALLEAQMWIQITVFVIVSAVALWFTRPLARKYINSRSQPTNADRAIGRTGIVRETIDNVAGTGAVALDGMTWTARSDTGEVIEAGARVRGERIEGVRLIVVRAEKDNIKEEK